jgi:hypothetical protein
VVDVIPLDHIRRSRKLLRLLVERFGVEHFLEAQADAVPRINPGAADAAVALAVDWIERRTGGDVERAAMEVMERQLRRLLIVRIAERLVATGR